MRNSTMVVIGVIGLFGVGGAVARGQQAGRGGGGGAAQAVPDAPIGKTAFWSAEDIQARWQENEAKKRNNSRLFNGPTNISANIRIVGDNDPATTHDTTADLWIVTAGTAIARTDGTIDTAAKSIRNGVQRPVKTGDILYVPPGIPHHFTDLKGFRAYLIRFDTLVGAESGPAGGGRRRRQQRSRKRATAPQPPVRTWRPTRPCSGRATISRRGGRTEANSASTRACAYGPANISGNVRIVLDNDPPATHEGTADLWIVTEGTAVARTDSQNRRQRRQKSISNGFNGR